MKKAISLFLCVLMLISAVTTASAKTISIEGLKEDKLRELYSQVQSQIQLSKLAKASKYTRVANYEDFARDPDDHKDENIRFTGTVIQVIEGNETTYRVSLDKSENQVFLVTYTLPKDGERFLEDDKVTVYGKYKGLHTYSSTVSKSVTVPYCEAALIIHPVTNSTVSGATPEELQAALKAIKKALNKTSSKDKKGYVKLTKKNYDSYAKNPGQYKDQKITFTGKALQVIDGSSATTIRVAVDSDSSRVVYLTLPNNLITFRILDDDQIVVKGTFTGLHTYSSTRGGEITIPACTAKSVTVKGYKAPPKASKNKKGYYKLTKKEYGDYSRRPGEHKKEKITFSAKVIQVIEGTDICEYRMAIDKDYDSIIYVTLSKDKRTTRILEDDVVTVTGTFAGLITYESTSGAPITIPKCTAKKVVIPGKKTTKASKSSSGKYTVTKKNYELFARDEDLYKSKPVIFTAKVVQVMEGDDTTRYRLAVDNSYDAIFYAEIANSKLKTRILEGDTVKVNGTSTGLYSYNSVRGGKITIPSCKIKTYKVKNYKQVKIGKPNDKGYYKITRKNYEELARNPKPYKDKKLTFKGKIVQVSERYGGENVYRIAVDSDYDCMFYIEYTLPAKASHLLENDTVTVKGTYYGIYTYTTIFGSAVSVPALIAKSIKR